MATEVPVAPSAEPMYGTQEDHKAMTFNLGNALDKIAGRDKVTSTKRTPASDTPREAPKPQETAKSVEEAPAAAVEPEGQAEPPASEEPPAEPTEETAPTHLNEKEKVAWAKYRKIEKAYETEVPQLKKQLEELTAKLGERDSVVTGFESDKKRLTELEQYQQDTEAELFRTRVQATKKWKEHVEHPFSNIKGQIENFAKTNELSADTIMDLMVRGDENALEEFATELSPWKQRKLEAWYGDIQTIERVKGDIEQNSKAAYETAMEEEKRNYEGLSQKQLEGRQNAIKSVSPKLGEAINALMPDDKKFDMDSLSREVAKYDQWPEEYRILGAMSAAMVPELMDAVKADRETIATLKSELTKLRGGAPKAGGGKVPNGAEKPQPDSGPVKLTKNSERDFFRGIGSRVAGSKF